MRYIMTILIAFLMFTSCQTDGIKTNEMIDKFTWNVQLAGYDFNKYDEKGETTLENFISEFDKFPWIEQIETAKRIQKGSAPTLSVKDLKTETDFWVSMAGDKNEHGYLIGIVYLKTVKGFFGLGGQKEKRWVEIYLTQDPELVRKCFKMFFNRDSDNLVSTIRKLEKFGEMAAQN
jgi:hypothetical protein